MRSSPCCWKNPGTTTFQSRWSSQGMGKDIILPPSWSTTMHHSLWPSHIHRSESRSHSFTSHTSTCIFPVPLLHPCWALANPSSLSLMMRWKLLRKRRVINRLPITCFKMLSSVCSLAWFVFNHYLHLQQGQFEACLIWCVRQKHAIAAHTHEHSAFCVQLSTTRKGCLSINKYFPKRTLTSQAREGTGRVMLLIIALPWPIHSWVHSEK